VLSCPGQAGSARHDQGHAATCPRTLFVAGCAVWHVAIGAAAGDAVGTARGAGVLRHSLAGDLWGALAPEILVPLRN